MAFKSGFITIIGRPNVGKSTLLNLLTGEKIAIMSNKPQTTRHKIKTIVTNEACQMVFIDTPGMHKPKNKLGEYMMNTASETLREVDLVLYLVEATDKKPGPGDTAIIELLKTVETPVCLLINKVETVEKETLLPLIDAYQQAYPFKEILPISALQKQTIPLVMNIVEKYLPEGPLLYPADMLTDQPERVIVQELIREKLLQLLNEEVPHGIGVEVDSYKEDKAKKLLTIDATIFCERETHKGIVIGKGGAMLKRIGTMARADIEKMVGHKVMLRLWVKVKDDWRNSDFMLNELGYK